MTAACWPELNAMMEHRSQWYLHLLAAYPGPAATAAAPPDEVRALLRKVSSGLLASARVEQVLRSAHTSMGEPLHESEQAFLQELVREILRLRASVAEVEKRMRAFIASDAEGSTSRVANVVGPALATTLLAEVGDPGTYASAAALEKACGLNLREKSSGQHQGKLRITKRGSPRVRQLLYMAAMRWLLEYPEAKAWYERRSAYAAGLKKKAVVAVMRKIVRALFHVARGSVFDVRKLFDTRALAETRGAPPTEPVGGRRARRVSPSSTRSPAPEGITSSAV
jgi:transposase